ncbi:hypothetical protein N9933_03565 [bacterium]|nr:hypothetical protein [bacterium]
MGQSVVLNHLIVKSEGASVKIEWEIQDESGVTEYQLYRKINEGSQFEFVETIYADGSLTYEYIDDEIFKNDAKVITYELRVVKNGKTHKFYSTLSHNPTAIQQTWGSIKNMFK